MGNGPWKRTGHRPTRHFDHVLTPCPESRRRFPANRAWRGSGNLRPRSLFALAGRDTISRAASALLHDCADHLPAARIALELTSTSAHSQNTHAGACERPRAGLCRPANPVARIQRPRAAHCRAEIVAGSRKKHQGHRFYDLLPVWLSRWNCARLSRAHQPDEPHAGIGATQRGKGLRGIARA